MPNCQGSGKTWQARTRYCKGWDGSQGGSSRREPWRFPDSGPILFRAIPSFPTSAIPAYSYDFRQFLVLTPASKKIEIPSCLRPDAQKLSAGTWTFDLCSLLNCGQWPHYTHTGTHTHTHARTGHTNLNKPAAEIWIPTMRGVRCVNRRYQKTNWEEVATRGEQPAQQCATICLDMSESTGGVPEWIVSVSSVQTSFVGCSPLNILHILCTPAFNQHDLMIVDLRDKCRRTHTHTQSASILVCLCVSCIVLKETCSVMNALCRFALKVVATWNQDLWYIAMQALCISPLFVAERDQAMRAITVTLPACVDVFGTRKI